MIRASASRLGGALVCVYLAACGSVPPVEVTTSPAPVEEVPVSPPPEDPVVKELRLRVDKLSAQLNDAHRRYNLLNDEFRRTETALHESQKKLDELQQKLDALRAIDRDTRRQPRR